MFSFFKNNYKEKAPETHPFYGARVCVEKSEIILYSHNDSNIEKIEIANIDFITIYCFDKFDEFARCWLCFNSYSSSQICITTLAGNYQSVENFVLKFTDFDSKTYFEIKNSTIEINNKVLWEKKSVSDFEIESKTESLFLNLNDGIFIENLNLLIAWKTYNDLEKNKLLIRKKTSYPNPIFSGISYHLKSATIFGGLKLSNLYTECDSFETKPKLDLPVLKYVSEIKLGFFNPKKEFLKIKKHLDEYFSQEASSQYQDVFDPNVNDSLYAVWTIDDVIVTLYCFYRKEYVKLDSNAWLNIEFNPNTDIFFESDYQKNLEINSNLSYHLFPFEVDLNVNYREMDNVIFIPKCFENLFENENQFLIWNDSLKKIIGFGNTKYARVFNSKDFKSVSLAIEDYKTIEGSNVLKIDESCLGTISSFKTIMFEKSIKKMEELTNKHFFTYNEDPNRWR